MEESRLRRTPIKEAAIRVDGLTKYYGPVIGVEDLSFEVGRGEIYGFLGANGAGKTTTIRLLLDLLRPSRGRAMVLGIDCRKSSMEARRQIGYLPGELPIYPDLTAAGYLDHLARLDGRPVAPEYRDELLDRFDVSEVDLRRRLRDQSHGMKQKIGIVQALMCRAPVLILDEPTAGLDPLMVHAFRETLEALKGSDDTTVLLSSHILAEVEATCDRIGIIRNGRMVATGTIDELRRSATRRVTILFKTAVDSSMAAIPGATILSAAPTRWELEVQGPLGPIVQALGPLPVHDVEVESFRLEDYVARFYSES
jgi:ABC-2 type transport system ATP-binding protein